LGEMSSIWRRTKPNTGLRKFELSYRPHPAPQGLKMDLARFAFPGIALSKELVHSRNEKCVFQSQDSVLRELARQRLVIGSPTTLVIEALMLGVPVIVPTFGGDHVRTSNAIMLERLEHLKVLRSLKNLVICDSITSLESAILRILGDPLPYANNDDLDFIVTTRPGSFATRCHEVFVNLLKI